METQELIASLALTQEAAVTYTDIDQAQDMLQINWDTRAVTIPKSVTNAGVKNDHLSKKLVFSMDRYVCGVDLANHTFAIHFINVDKWDSKKKNYDDCASGVYPVTNIDLSVDGKVTCEWEITNAATQVVGDVVFALHVFTIVDSAFTYHLGTTPTLLDLLDTVNATEHGKNITPDEIEVYIQKMADLSAEIDAKVAAAEAAATRAEEAAANFEVDDTLSVAGKAADAAATGAKLSQLSGENAELKSDIGAKSNLNTDDKTSIVNAVNEVNNRFLEPVADAVEDWLNDHPEATTTVQDNSLSTSKYQDESVTIEKIDRLSKNIFKNGTILPIYKGDYLSEKLPSCCLKIDEYVYMFDGIEYNSNVGSNLSNVHIYQGDSFVEKKEVELAHANSCCYDGTHIYIVPTWDFANNKSNAMFIYKYNRSFSLKETISTPVQFMGVSYDNVTNRMYAYGYDKKIYEYVDGIFSPITNSIDLDSQYEYNQDFCINDGIFYCSAPGGMVVVGRLNGTNTKINNYFNISSIDLDGRWKTGELEGFEFSNDGYMYAIKQTKINNDVFNGFFVCVPTGNKNNLGTAKISYSEANYSLNLVTDKRLSIGEAEIRSFNQLNALITLPNAINILTPQILENEIVNHSIMLNLKANLTISELRVYRGDLNIYNDSDTAVLNILTNKINLSRTSRLILSGKQLKLVNPLDITVGFYSPITIVRTLPDKNLTIADKLVTEYGMYVGSSKVNYNTIDKGSFSIQCDKGQQPVMYRVDFNKQFNSVPNVQITMATSTDGYSDMSTFKHWIKSIDVNGFDLVIYFNIENSARTPAFYWTAIS